MGLLSRVLVLVGGLLGAGGVAAAAASSHAVDSRNLAAIATIFLAHGPTLLALGLYGQSRILAWSGVILAAGSLLFGGDLICRELLGQGLFPGAAPLGGGLMMLGWLGVAGGAFAGLRPKRLKKE